MVLSLLNHIQVFWQFCQLELLGLLTGLDRVWHTGLLDNLKSLGTSGQIFGLILSFSVIDSFKVFWTRSVHKKIHLMLELLKAPFLVQYLFYYIFMTILMILSVIMVCLQIIYSKFDHVFDLWWQLQLASEFNLICKAQWTGTQRGLLVSILENSTGFIWPV